jgi:hypothetical protein
MTTPSVEKEASLQVPQREARRDAVWMGELVEETVPELLRSYQRAGGLNNRDAHNMPSKRDVGRICEDLLQILFPGFHDSDAVRDGSLDELTATRLAGVISQLTDQVRKSVRIGDPHKPTGARRRSSGSFASPCPTCAISCELTSRPPSTAIPPRCIARKSSFPIRSLKPLPFKGWPTGSITTARRWCRA